MLFWLCLILGGAIGAFIGYIDLESIPEAIGGFMIGALGGVCVWLVFIFLTVFPWGHTTTHHQATHHHNVVALQDNFGATGDFSNGLFFGTGFIGGKVYYSWYEKLPDGTLKGVTIHDDSSDQIRIREVGPNQQPNVVETDYRSDFASKWWYAPWNMSLEDPEEHTNWLVVVPKGTIVRDFKLNLH
jgi:hypothetical protein